MELTVSVDSKFFNLLRSESHLKISLNIYYMEEFYIVSLNLSLEKYFKMHSLET